jgi:hypothetical protein
MTAQPTRHRCAGRSLYWDARSPLDRAAAKELQAAIDALGAAARSQMVMLGDLLRPAFEAAGEALRGLIDTLTASGLIPTPDHAVGGEP